MRSRSVFLLALRRRLYALFAALLLATACLQAVEPMAAPLERSQGSAFSASTIDVAIVRPQAGQAPRQVPAPAPLPLAILPRAAGVTVAAPPAVTPARPGSTGPPPADPRIVRPGPRGPPLS